MTARDAFNVALRAVLDDGRTPPCADDERFTSDKAAERAAVVTWCNRCPLTTACAALATEERPVWGVWGPGRDYSPTTRAPGRPNETERTPTSRTDDRR